MSTRQQTFEYIQRELDLLTQEQYLNQQVHTAYIYQAGLLTSILTDLCQHDSTNLVHFRRVIKQARERKQNKKINKQ
jgi:hypothetical protein